MPYTALSLLKQGAIVRITLSRPAARNAIDAVTLRELARACDAIAADADMRCAVLTAEGECFSSGWDWQALAAVGGGSLPEAARSQGNAGDPFACLATLPQPVVCAINGDALGAGLELALACDVLIAAEGARLALPEVTLGMLPMGGGTQRLPRLVGRGKALEMLLTGEPVDAQEALRIGLVSAVVPPAHLLEEAEAVALRIAQRGPLAVRYAKEAVSRGIEMPLAQALRYETDLTVILQTTEDRAEGVRAFLDKRKPAFKGR